MRRYACTAALPPVRGAIMMDAARSALRRARAEPPLRPQDRAGDGCRRAIHRLRPLQGPLLLRPSGMMGLRLWEEESYTRTSTCTHAGDSEGTPHCAGHDCSTSGMPFSCRTKFCSTLPWWLALRHRPLLTPYPSRAHGEADGTSHQTRKMRALLQEGPHCRKTEDQGQRPRAGTGRALKLLVTHQIRTVLGGRPAYVLGSQRWG